MESQQKNEASVPWQWINCIQSIIKMPGDLKGDLPTKQMPTDISPWLFLSDEKTACNARKLKSVGITHVLSLCGAPAYKLDWLKNEYQDVGIINKRIHAEDEEGYDLIGRHWQDCFEFLSFVHQDPKNKVLVHCVAGINRSGLVACAAYMIFEDVNVLDSVRHCTDKRGHRFLWNKSFQKQLCCLAAQHDLLGDAPDGFSDKQVGRETTRPPPIRALDRLV